MQLNQSHASLEAIIIKLILTNVDIYYMGVYRPPDKSVDEFIELLDDVIMKLPSHNQYELNKICDTNIDLSGARTPSIKVRTA